jgi:PKHD-type hydroxylase
MDQSKYMIFTNEKSLTENPLNWYWFDNGFNSEEVERIKKLVEKFELSEAGVTQKAISDYNVRKSSTAWIPKNEEFYWIYEKLSKYINQANLDVWGFDLFGMAEDIQYTEYYQNGGHYDYHLDVGNGFPLNQRKISVTVQLSDPDEYTGGDFEILIGSNPEKLPRGKGVVLIFPSFFLHRVTPVTKGIRKSLVLWVGGGSYR